MILRKLFQLISALLCLTAIAFAEERFGLQGIVDGTLRYHDLSDISLPGPTSQTNLNGQFVVLGSLRIGNGLSAFYEGRINHTEGLDGSSPRIQQTRTNSVVQAYLQFSPRLPWDLNLQIGKFGTPFGEFLTRNYSNENPLVGFPLIYTHRTPIRADQFPQNPYYLVSPQSDDTSPGYFGGTDDDTRLPLLNFSYPTGIMAFGNPGKFDYRIALVNSSLANPLDLGTPGQRVQWVAAGGINCFPGLHLGASFAEGPYLDSSVSSVLPPGTSLNEFKQRALGFDFQYAIHHFEAYGELIFNTFQVPHISQGLGATGYYVELKYTWSPRFFSAMRWNQIYFDRLRSGLSSDARPRFDNNVNSLELGLGYRLTEKLLAKGSYQLNQTLGGHDTYNSVLALQVVYSLNIWDLLRGR
jgi:hypothetical protein